MSEEFLEDLQYPESTITSTPPNHVAWFMQLEHWVEFQSSEYVPTVQACQYMPSISDSPGCQYLKLAVIELSVVKSM